VRVIVDFDRCQSNGECVVAAPDVFALDEQDFLQVNEEQPEEQRAAVEQAVRVCPTGAITIEG
jgi:ferredoxin